MNNTPFHFLVADDDPDDHELFRYALQELPMTVKLTTVDNGEALMGWLYENMHTLPRLLFLDLNMHRKTGFECLLEIKQSSLLQSLPVIIFSTSINRKDVERLYQSGTLYYVRKPTDLTC